MPSSQAIDRITQGLSAFYALTICYRLPTIENAATNKLDMLG
jgi:hypothetical protein